MPAQVGTMERPCQTNESIKLARDFIEAMHTEKGARGLWWHNREFFVWYGGTRWVLRTVDQMWNMVALWLEGAWVVGGVDVVKKIKFENRLVGEIVRLLQTVGELPFEKMPVFVDPPEDWAGVDRGTVIAFEDVLVSVQGGVVKTTPRDRRWIDMVTLKVPYQPEAGCPAWLKALGQWSGGDPKWVDLLRRWIGYCLMSTRKYERWMLMQGEIRSGKGTINKVVQALIRKPAFYSTSLELLGDQFGLAGTQHARVISIQEVNALDPRTGESLASVMKRIVGRDPVRVNDKNEKRFEAEVDAAIVLASNVIPLIPNHGMGISGKMLVLPFRTSFKDKEDLDLLKTLLGELPGIAAWAVEGARELEASPSPSERWPVPEEAEAVHRRYRLANNALDAFLEARFVRNPVGHVASKILWSEWMDYARANPEMVGRMRVGRNSIKTRLLQESTWRLEEYREGSGGHRGLRGLSLRRENEDEQ